VSFVGGAFLAALELDLFLSLELQEFPAHLLVSQLQGREPR
jgi:hypothetical protein